MSVLESEKKTLYASFTNSLTPRTTYKDFHLNIKHIFVIKFYNILHEIY